MQSKTNTSQCSKQVGVMPERHQLCRSCLITCPCSMTRAIMAVEALIACAEPIAALSMPRALVQARMLKGIVTERPSPALYDARAPSQGSTASDDCSALANRVGTHLLMPKPFAMYLNLLHTVSGTYVRTLAASTW